MSRGRQEISSKGLLQKNVLGAFKAIRGFAVGHGALERIPGQGLHHGR